MLWIKNNKILQNSAGQVVDAAECCCGCLDCSRVPSSIVLNFTAEPSSLGASGWIGAWELPAAGGCCYELDEGLPCGAVKLRACILSSGSASYALAGPHVGDYQLHVEATYPGGAIEGFTAHIDVDPESNDCVANGNGSPDSVGIGPSGGGPCNFLNLLTNPGDLTITSNP